MTVAELLMLAALGILLIAGVFDLVRMEIPDSLSIILLLLAGSHWAAAPAGSIWSPIAALAVMLGLGILLFARGWMGGGDIKLLVALSPLPGLQGLPLLLATIAIAGGLLGVLLLGLRIGLGSAVTDPMRLPKVLRREAPLPYAVAIAAGTAFWAGRTELLPV